MSDKTDGETGKEKEKQRGRNRKFYISEYEWNPQGL